MGNFDKPYEELLFTDNFMFVYVMEHYPDLCREMLELILAVRIDRIESISTEHSVDSVYESKGIRLDVLVRDSGGSIYDAEMQVVVQPDLPKRSRYYHSVIDTGHLFKGEDYENLKPVYVIFICVGRLRFEKQKPVYFFRMVDTDGQIDLKDMTFTVFVNSDYINGSPDDGSVSVEMREFLHLVNRGRTEGNENTLAKEIEKLVGDLKEKKEGRPKYMTAYDEIQREGRIKFQEGLKEGREEGLKEGREEGREEGLKEGREEGREEGRAEGMHALIQLVEGSFITLEIAAESLGMTVEEFTSMAALLK